MSRNHPLLYEISTVPWLAELSKGLDRPVRLGNVPAAEWDRLAQTGFDFVWLMGVWQKSPMGRQIWRQAEEMFELYGSVLPGWTPEEVIGSPYSIQAYEPDFSAGDWEDLDKARAELAKRGMGLILDFVPNHTAPDHPWARTHPEHYIQADLERSRRDPQAFLAADSDDESLFLAKGRDPYFPPWKDTLQLNYFHPSTRAAMIQVLQTIGQHCDGVRCDMAMLVLNDIFESTWKELLKESRPASEFWQEARAAVPDMIWIAEAYWDTEWALQKLGFDYVYDKRLYDRSRSSSAHEINLHLQADRDYQSRLIRFLENHDEGRAAAEFEQPRLQAAATLFSTLPGMKLYNQGQFEGRRIHLPVQLIASSDEERDMGLAAFYEKLLSIINHNCFHEGEWFHLATRGHEDESFHNLICYYWKSAATARLIVINFQDSTSQGRVMLDGHVDPAKGYVLKDLWTEQSYQRNGGEMSQQGLHVILAGFQSHIFSVDAT